MSAGSSAGRRRGGLGGWAGPALSHLRRGPNARQLMSGAVPCCLGTARDRTVRFRALSRSF
eukprot:1990043-Alexandrium_andersonii.AAC.1